MADTSSALDLAKPVPEGFDKLWKALLDMTEGRGRHDKRCDWNMGRHIAYFMDSDHKEKYGRHTMEQLSERIGYKPVTLYAYAAVYKAYASNKSLTRVLKRDKVTASMMGLLAALPSDAQRDQVERRIQGASTQMTHIEVRDIVDKMMGRRHSVDGRTNDPIVLCTRLYEKVDKQVASIMSLLNEGVQLESGLVKAAKKPDAEVPKAVLQRRKETLALIKKASKVLDKYSGFVESHDL